MYYIKTTEVSKVSNLITQLDKEFNNRISVKVNAAKEGLNFSFTRGSEHDKSEFVNQLSELLYQNTGASIE